MLGTREERMEAVEAIHAPWKKKTIWDRLLDCAERCPDREFLVFSNGVRYTYAQTVAESERIAAGLASSGVMRGDHVGIKAFSGPESALLIFALARLEAVKVAINTGVGPYELRYILDKADCSCLITDGPVALEAIAELPKMNLVVGIGDCLQDAPENLRGFTSSWQDMVGAGNPEGLATYQGQADDFVDIMFTSGSTGNPKGVPLTHDKLFRSAYANTLNRGFEDGRRIFTALPLYHCFAYVEGILASLFVAGTMLIYCGRFDAVDCLRFIRDEKANDILNVPYMAMRFIEHLRENPMEFDGLHAMYCAGEPCPDWVWAGIREQMGILDVVNGFGMTEICGAAMQTRPSDPDSVRGNRVGRIMPAGAAGSSEYGGHVMEYKAVDVETREDLPAGQAGELLCRGLSLMEGYYRDIDATYEAFTADGWLKTGDLGCFDEDGYLELIGRIKDTYRINGENVSPHFLEQIIEKCPVVGKAVVVGVPNERLGAVGALFAQLTEDTPENRAELERFCKASLASFQVPRYYFYLADEDWPRTSSGKIQNFKLREMAAERAAEGA